MSAGGLIGLFLNFFTFAAIWMVIGNVFDRIGVIFNTQISLMPTMQDAVNGFALSQMIYSALPIIVLVMLCINYVVTENSRAGGEV